MCVSVPLLPGSLPVYLPLRSENVQARGDHHAVRYMAVKVLVHPQKLDDSASSATSVAASLRWPSLLRWSGAFFVRFLLLSWRLHPQTAVAMGSILLDYVSELSAVCPSQMSTSTRSTTSSPSLRSWLSVTTSFVTLRPSTVPLAAILNSLEGVLSYEDDVIARVMEDVAALNFLEWIIKSCRRHTTAFGNPTRRARKGLVIWELSGRVFLSRGP